MGWNVETHVYWISNVFEPVTDSFDWFLIPRWIYRKQELCRHFEYTIP
jgi:hypothetical protein